MPDKKMVIVTGGSRGIGAATCEKLLSKGYGVISLSRTEPASTDIVHLPCDLTDTDGRRAVFANLSKRDDVFGLVNNAGVATPNLIKEFDHQIYSGVMDVNTTSVAELSAAVVPSLIKNKQGRVVNISSELILGFATRTAYSASKAAVASFAKTWALELGQYNICCNAIAPGPVETELFVKNNPPGSAIRQQKLDKIPLGRFGQPEDVANMVAFLMSEEASFITGQTLYVCGGSSLGSVPI
jgi:NAD(P)-dependent dehydrogenase (short-subunit alcohol dehydrogenase family)